MAWAFLVALFVGFFVQGGALTITHNFRPEMKYVCLIIKKARSYEIFLLLSSQLYWLITAWFSFVPASRFKPFVSPNSPIFKEELV
jgi:hypothetical protein